MKLISMITLRDEGSINRYFLELSKISAISADREIELAKRIKRGDKQALDELVTANLRFVVSVAKQFQNQGLSLGDLINEGNLGLIKAAERFDETRGFRFISYAVWWIRQIIMLAIVEQSRMVRLPMNQASKVNKLKKTTAVLGQRLNRDPTASELGEELGHDEAREASKLNHIYLSLETGKKNEDDEGINLLETLQNKQEEAPGQELIKESLQEDVKEILSILNSKELLIVKLAFGIGYERSSTLEQIGGTLNLTRERVRQIKLIALKKLRKSKKIEFLRDYLG